MADLLHTWGPANVGELLASTNEKRIKKEVADAVFNRIPTLEYLNSKGKMMVDGGAALLVDLEVASNSTAAFYSGYDVIDTTPQDNHTTAQYEWKQAAASVTISGRQSDIQNTGESSVHKLLDKKQRNAEKTLRNIVNAKIHASGNSSKEVLSLRTLIDATSTIGDINSTSNSYWQSEVKAGGEFASQGVADWRNIYNTLKNKQGNPDMIITTQTIFEAYEATMTPQIRYSKDETGNIKFKDLEFAGAMVRFDDQCESGVSYFLDSDVLNLVIHNNRNFIYNTPVRPPGQDAVEMEYLVALALTTSNRRLLGKVTGQS